MLKIAAGLLFALSFAAAEPAWREDFAAPSAAWRLDATRLLVPATRFRVEKAGEASDGNALVIECRKSTGAFLRIFDKTINLNRTPYLRWRWRVANLPAGADGRKFATDDQPVAVYLVAGGTFNRRGIAYRWETETPAGFVGDLKYSAAMKIRFFCLRNKETAPGTWMTEIRNVRDDFKAAYGFVPDTFAVSVCGNSQHTGSVTRAEIDFLEFRSEPPPASVDDTRNPAQASEKKP